MRRSGRPAGRSAGPHRRWEPSPQTTVLAFRLAAASAAYAEEPRAPGVVEIDARGKPAVVEKVVGQNRDAVAACVAGSAVLAWRVVPPGAVEAIEIVEAPGEALGACMREIVAVMTFPWGKGQRPYGVRYRFVVPQPGE